MMNTKLEERATKALKFINQYLARDLKKEIKECKEDLAHAHELRLELMPMVNRFKYKNQWYWKMVVEMIHLEPWTDGRQLRIEKARRQLAELAGKGKRYDNGFTAADIERARGVPIEVLYRGELRMVGGRKTGLCPFHKEKHASFVVYEDNHFHCFGGCGAHGNNAIDYVMKRDGVGFREAVKKLITR
jgi:hypothetical protein